MGTEKAWEGAIPSRFLYKGGDLRMDLRLYNIDKDYCLYLRQFDSKVPIVSYGKEHRPFIGILIVVNNLDYYAPLTSPKPKHITMSNGADFIKINAGKWGAINLNNMIPVLPQNLIGVQTNILTTDTPQETNYKYLLKNQLQWCTSNSAQIIRQAQRLYNMITSGRAYPGLMVRCCDFSVLEAKCAAYASGK